MLKNIMTVCFLTLSAAVPLSAAQAGGNLVNTGVGNGSDMTVNGKVHINQNGNGCRNRCYGEQEFNAGYNNGNEVVAAGTLNLSGSANIGVGNGSDMTVNGKAHINQNGNGCRNRCYGEQEFNAGWNNGNQVVLPAPAFGHAKKYGFGK